MANVILEHVYKRYEGGVVAVSDFNLNIEDREFIILVGPSGCGKSTTLRMVAGLEDISDGIIKIDNEVVNDKQPKDRDIAMVFQNYALYPHMTVFDNMAFGLKLRKIPKDEINRRVTEAAKILEIEQYLERKPKALSGGQRQRVALGRAIVRDPKVFLMDEPLSNLDAKLRVQMRVEITRLHHRLNTTIIYVTHDQTEAMTMGTRIVVMKDGFIQQVASPSELYQHPVNVFVAGFIGMPPMNFINGKVVKTSKGVGVKFGSIELTLDQAKYDVPAVNSYIDKEVVIGIRPEAMDDNLELVAENPNSKFTASVDVVEMLGAETYLYIAADGLNLTARVEPTVSTSKVGQDIEVMVDPLRVALFDKETEVAIIT